MLSIIIADDEAGIIDLCRALIDYPNAAVVGEAHNGLELFDMIGELHPNTVITDINMPGLTGLELIEKAGKAYPDVNFIVMSGYTDFEYVQSALRFGVWDYLLKPLQKLELNRILKKLDAHLEGQRVQAALRESVLSSLDESLALLQERYVREVWEKGVPVPVQEMKARRIIDFAGKRLQCLVLHSEGQLLQSQSAEASSSLRMSQMVEMITEYAASHDMEAYFSSQGSLAIGLLLYPSGSADALWEALKPALRAKLSHVNSQFQFYRASCAASMLLTADEDQCPIAMRQARAALDWRLERPDPPLIAYDPETDRRSERFEAYASLGALRDAVAASNITSACSLVSRAWEGADFSVPGSRAKRCRELLDCVNQALGALPSAGEMDAPLFLDPRDMISGGTEPVKICAKMQQGVREALESYRDFLDRREGSVISRAKQFILQHQSEDISLNDVAAAVCLSPAYFSSLLKQETGVGFIKYLQHARIERARTLLRETNRNVRDIAEEVGYRDLKFFNKIFINETSVTPSEYRKFYK